MIFDNLNEEIRSAFELDQKIAIPTLVLLTHKLLFIYVDKELSAQLSALCDKMGIAPNKFKQTSDINLINTQKHLQELYYV